jgi:hypothetical protein
VLLKTKSYREYLPSSVGEVILEYRYLLVGFPRNLLISELEAKN